MPTFLSRPRPLVRAALRALLLPALTILVAFAATLAFPHAAHADTYALPSVHIQAQVMENGDLFVTEARTFAFEDTVNGVYWDIPFADNEQGSASAVSVLDVRELDDAPEDEADARRASQPMQEVSSANSGDGHVYTVENLDDSLRLKVFIPREDGDEATVWVSYMIEGAVMAWPDTAELYWQFIGSEWEEDAEDVRLDVTFAGAAAGTPATSSSSDANLRAWGHGPLDGEVSLDATDPANPHVVLGAPMVHAGQFAEVRATFPTDWVPGLAASGEPRLESVLSEEAAWAEEANAQREGARQVAFAGTAALTVAPAIMLGVVVYLRKTRYASPKPVFDETYFRDLPSNDHPAVLSALVYGGTVQDCAFVATLMKLTDDRVIKIKHETRTEDRFLGLGEKKVEEYSIELAARERITDPIDLAAIDLCFGPDAKNGDEVRFGAFQNQESVGEYMQSFKDQVLAELERRNLTNLAPDTFRYAPAALAALIVFGCIAFAIFTDGVNLPLIILGGALAIAAAVIAERTNVHSPEAVELLNRCQALERWLEDFTNLDDAVPDDLILWNKMLVLAVAFGVSDEVLRQLADAVPVDRRVDENGMYYYPSYWWYYSHGSLHSPMSEMHDVYQATVAELASSSNSSAGGFGGGFSGGGGGGVGGGGGGTF
ncbi:hypothetical protein COLINT_03572 [Collinsella intestinalis DSM 13280]|uniref:Tat pathway signal sequence domain protein n=1 Tax=Collinsella intestinalis DSM 13280 TaxID=521003 RepID=C4FBV9_9ACTN|nr:DUF2207 domain-containing protein [Collinsella intestinalis]EEP43658.1 hypothetical protein COLINT_03572 [Collinsella intestinalis DSM 13280]